MPPKCQAWEPGQLVSPHPQNRVQPKLDKNLTFCYDDCHGEYQAALVVLQPFLE
jgi:hypothetical protein